MEMSAADIKRSYEQAGPSPKDKKNQIQILAELNGCDRDTIREILIKQGVPEAEIGPAPSRKLLKRVPKTQEPLPLEQCWDVLRKELGTDADTEELKRIVESLPPERAEFISMRYGLNDGLPMTFGRVAGAKGKSAEWVRSSIEKAKRDILAALAKTEVTEARKRPEPERKEEKAEREAPKAEQSMPEVKQEPDTPEPEQKQSAQLPDFIRAVLLDRVAALERSAYDLNLQLEPLMEQIQQIKENQAERMRDRQRILDYLGGEDGDQGGN